MNDKNDLPRRKAAVLRLISEGRLDEALPACRQVCAVEPTVADNWLVMATIDARLGQLPHAADCCRKAINIQPDSLQAHLSLGRVLQLQERYAEAESSFREALALAPDRHEVHFGLGQILQQQQRLAEAIASYDAALRLDRGLWQAWFNKGLLLQSRGELESAEQCCRQALGIRPDFAPAWYNLGNLLYQRGNTSEAESCYRKAVQYSPDYLEAWANLGKLQQSCGRFSSAGETFREALLVSPDNADLYNELGMSLNARGRMEEAEQAFRKAVALNPDFHEANSNLLLALNYSSRYTPAQVFAEHERWGRYAHERIRREHGFLNEMDPDRRLRIGYVSPDFRDHSVACFFETLLKHHDPEGFETVCYSDARRADAVTRRLQSWSGGWRDIHGRSHEEVAELVQADRIDILVDLCGHTAGNRLLLFASRPAPLQVTWLGYPNTTGLKEMDYRLTDEWSDPTATADPYYTESLVRLPGCFLCYTPDIEAPLPGGCASDESGGQVMFGSFNSYVKTTPEVLGLWASILHAVPGSRLLLKNVSLGDPEVRATCRAHFENLGIQPERLELHGAIASKRGHLGLYRRMDIGLDTFPYNGTTTTCEALWMGIPVVTLAGDHHAGRVGVSLLSTLGLQQLIARNEGDYRELAVSLAHNNHLRQRWHTSLREMMRGSPLCDGPGFCRGVESAYREMWTGWCQGRP